jgi:hypothetical protein
MPDLNNLPDTHTFLTSKRVIMRELPTISLLIQSRIGRLIYADKTS